MLINEIPDDCLLAIFDYINNLDDLMNCYKVCVIWSNLIAKRTKKTKYLSAKFWFVSEDPGYSSDAVYYRGARPIDSTCLSRLFTNLIIAELSPRLHRKVEDAIEFVSKQKSLKGLINFFDEPIEKYCDQLEMLSVNTINPNNLQNGSSIKQLDVRSYSLEALGRDAHYFPNLERLNISIGVPDNRYDGPVLEKLKILGMAFLRPRDNIFYGFHLIDSCPNLQSAHILMSANTMNFVPTLKHKCLQDLVLQFYGINNADDTWNYFKRMLVKYPNLKHLALRGRCIITDEHIEELVHILPNLVLLDVIECKDVTQTAADYVKDHCERYGRSIKFYFKGNEHEIRSDWPQLSDKLEKISRGFDFMKHCFLKDWTRGGPSPLLIPIGY